MPRAWPAVPMASTSTTVKPASRDQNIYQHCSSLRSAQASEGCMNSLHTHNTGMHTLSAPSVELHAGNNSLDCVLQLFMLQTRIVLLPTGCINARHWLPLMLQRTAAGVCDDKSKGS